MEADMEATRLATHIRANHRLKSFVDTNRLMNFDLHSEVDTSIVVVAYGQPGLLFLTLETIFLEIANALYKYEVIVVDNSVDENEMRFISQMRGVKYIRSIRNLGFGPACNHGAVLSSGECIIFVNPDMDICPGCFDAINNELRSSNDIGIVGGKLIFLNGEIQEAGGLIKNDNQITYGYLRGSRDHEESSALCKRDTFYVSGCLLGIKKDTFEELDGFDDAYAPAYFEDTDLCVRAVKLGYRVVYEPSAVAFHFENATMKDRADVEQRLESRRELFRRNHFDFINSLPNIGLSAFGDAREKPFEFRVLYIDDQVPESTAGSGFPRSRTIVESMVRLGYFVTVVALNANKSFKVHTLPSHVEVISGPSIDALRSKILDREGFYDLIWISRPHNIWLMKKSAGDLVLNKKYFKEGVVFDAEAIFSSREFIEGMIKNGYHSTPLAAARISKELENYSGSTQLVTVSSVEKAAFQAFGINNISVLGHQVDIKRKLVTFDGSSDFVFMGNLEALDSPNSDSMNWFIQDCWTDIKLILPGVRLRLIGRGSEKFYQGGDESVVVHGEVKDLAEILSSARIFIAPTRYAAGIPHKIHEASAYGIPCVMTSLLAAQLQWKDGVHCLAVGWNDTASFIKNCINAYQNRSLWESLQTHMIESLSEEMSSDDFMREVRNICEPIGRW